MSNRRLGTTLKNLVLALLNATLILLALCLWLGLRIASEVRGATENLSLNLGLVQPLQQDAAAIATQVAGLRADLAAASDRVGELPPEVIENLREKSDQLQAPLDKLSQIAERIAIDPGILAERAAIAAVAKLGQEAQQLRQCRLPSDPVP